MINNILHSQIEDDTASKIVMLFDPSTALFKEMLKYEGILLGVCTFLGILYSTFLIARRRKAKIMSSSGKE